MADDGDLDEAISRRPYNPDGEIGRRCQGFCVQIFLSVKENVFKTVARPAMM